MIQRQTIQRTVLAEHDDKRNVEVLQRVSMESPRHAANIQRGDTIIMKQDGDEEYWGEVKAVGDDISSVGGIHVLLNSHTDHEESNPVHLRLFYTYLEQGKCRIEGVRTRQYAEVAGVDY